jgi:hypothetical protein
MEAALRVLGDGLSIAALSIMGAASRMAWKRKVKDVLRPDAIWGRRQADLAASKRGRPAGLPVLAFAILLPSP